MKKYKAKENGIFKNEDAQLIGEFIERNFPEGRHSPREIVDLARNRSCPIHKYFDWNDTTAAEKWRLSQARHMVNNLIVIVEHREVPAFVNVFVKEDNRNRYVDIKNAMESESLWGQVVEDALKQVMYWKKRYETYSEFSGIVSEINEMEKRFYGNKESKEKDRRNSRDSTIRAKKGKDKNQRDFPINGQQIR